VGDARSIWIASLTIIANALRVGDRIVQQLGG